MNWNRQKTKIVCTIGPATNTKSMLTKIIKSGIDVIRLNLAHGSLDEHKNTIEYIKNISSTLNKRVAILADLPGPKIRIGVLEKPINLKRNDKVLLTPHLQNNMNNIIQIPLELPSVKKVLKKGDKIFLSDGFIVLTVESHKEEGIYAKVQNSGVLVSHKGVNLPHMELKDSAFTKDDKILSKFALEMGVDAISISFTESSDDIIQSREYLKSIGYDDVFIIAKIERANAIKNIDNILKHADGIMIARGDLGVEVAIDSIGLLQKQLIRKARLFNKPVITATQMLESMIHQPRPTRAEITDITNAILDGTDAVMLSEETAIGDYPLLAINLLKKIAKNVENSKLHTHIEELEDFNDNVESVIAKQVSYATKILKPICIISPTKSGATPRRISKFRLNTWIIGMSKNEKVCQELCFSYGVYPVYIKQSQDIWENIAKEWLNKNHKKKGIFLLTQGSSSENQQNTNRLDVIKL